MSNSYLYRPFPIILFSRPMTLALYCIEYSRIFTYNYSWVHRRPRGWVEFGGYVSLEKFGAPKNGVRLRSSDVHQTCEQEAAGRRDEKMKRGGDDSE